MFPLNAKIVIKSATGKWEFDKVAGAEIVRDADSLTQTCTLTLPKKVVWEGEPEMPIRRGDEVSVQFGYGDRLEEVFTGYVATIGVKSPIKIACEDYMFVLKQKEAVKKSYTSATVDRLLKEQNLGITHKVFGEQNIGQYRITGNTVGEVLGNLKDNGSIRSFIKTENGQPVLYSGVLFDMAQKGAKQVFLGGKDENRNIIDDNNLDVQNAKDIKIKLKAVSLLPNNKRIKIEVGDADGEVRTVHAYNKTETELRNWAQQELDHLKRDGLKGGFTTFGGDVLDRLDNIGVKIDGKRMGVYQVRKNEITYTTGGYRQKITLGYRIGD